MPPVTPRSTRLPCMAADYPQPAWSRASHIRSGAIAGGYERGFACAFRALCAGGAPSATDRRRLERRQPLRDLTVFAVASQGLATCGRVRSDRSRTPVPLPARVV